MVVNTFRSAARGDLQVLACRTSTFGPRSFAASASKLWNSLPLSLRDPTRTLRWFCSRLKTHHFSMAYGCALVTAIGTTYIFSYIHRKTDKNKQLNRYRQTDRQTRCKQINSSVVLLYNCCERRTLSLLCCCLLFVVNYVCATEAVRFVFC